MEVIKYLEVKAYIHNKIKVTVEIDYSQETISLMESKSKLKNYVFAGRGLNYMNGWRNILDAMKFAIGEAEKDLKKHVDAKERAKSKFFRRVAGRIIKDKN